MILLQRSAVTTGPAANRSDWGQQMDSLEVEGVERWVKEEGDSGDGDAACDWLGHTELAGVGREKKV